MSAEHAPTATQTEPRELEAFLDDPKTHQYVKHSWRPYLEAKPGFRNHWRPALCSRDLTGDAPRPVTLLGEHILLR
ncbi:MAG TPA: hypothetical protein VNN62_23230 [Methylomirabilota bacterium]|jgi:carbazole 1,9a-dioxygenase terminal dioxygenase component|nr:hypothetical protein [Methylomirabilota bacterium]